MTETKMPSVSVGFPVYNEEETVGEVLREAHEILAHSGLDYEILVCNDGSTDGSLDIVKNIAGQFPNMRIINQQCNLGIRATFENLYKESKKEFVFLNATDKQWDTSILLKMLPLLENADIVIASRKKKPYHLFRKLVSQLFNLLPRLLFNVRTFDAGAVKLVKREIINRFRLISKTPFSEAERLIRASRAGYRIVNCPVEVSMRQAGRSKAIKVMVLFNAFFDVFRVWADIYFQKNRTHSDT